jgi:uncharacterized peroxidase-related enzyme
MKSAWIKMLTDEQAPEDVKQIFNKARSPHGTLDNVMRVHSLRPETMLGHIALYRSVLHSKDVTLPLWFLEVVASYVSLINHCDYSFTHHWHNAERLINNPSRAQNIRNVLETDIPEDVFQFKELRLLQYAKKLTSSVQTMKKSDITRLQEIGISDGEILEVNQVVAYFNYSNRLLNGLGVTTTGDVVGYYKD